MKILKQGNNLKTLSTLLTLLTFSTLAISGYNTKKALVEINDPQAQRNPVKSVSAAAWKAVDVQGKIKPKRGQDISIVCEGGFPAGYIATDLLRPNGNFNRDFTINSQTTVLDLCNQQEDRMRQINPRLFK